MKQKINSIGNPNHESETLLKDEYYLQIENSLNILFSRSSQNLIADHTKLKTENVFVMMPYNRFEDLKVYLNNIADTDLTPDKIIFRNYFSNCSTVVDDLKKLKSLLVHSCDIYIQEVDFCQITCFPFNFAMARSLNLFKELNLVENSNSSIGSSLFSLLTQSGFKIVESNYLTPYFLDDHQRNSLAILFDQKLNHVKLNKLIVEPEKIALSAEISSYLSNMHNLVSLPRTIQIKSKNLFSQQKRESK